MPTTVLRWGRVTGRLMAELIAEEGPVVDPTPFRADRF
jgi:glycine/D-amino acid oxidase-like deaminating enzyme